MKYIKIIVAGLISAVLFFGCQEEKNRFSIEGRITHAEGRKIFLEELLVSSAKPVDSTVINKRGEFKFEGTTGLPTYYLLKFSDSKFVTLLIDSLENVIIEADIANFERNYSVDGSPGSAHVKMLNDHLLQTRNKLDSLKSLANLYEGNPDYPQITVQLEEESMRIKREQTEFSKKFVMENPFSMA